MAETKLARDLRPGDVVLLNDPDFHGPQRLQVAGSEPSGGSVRVFWRKPNDGGISLSAFRADEPLRLASDAAG